MIPAKGQAPGAFVLTSYSDGKKYVASDRTLRAIINIIGEDELDRQFNVEWVLLDEEERKLAEEIRRKYFA